MIFICWIDYIINQKYEILLALLFFSSNLSIAFSFKLMKHLWTNSDGILLAYFFLLSTIEFWALYFSCLTNFKAYGEDLFNSSYLPVFAFKNLCAFLYNYLLNFIINGHFYLICSIASYLFLTEIFAFAFKFLANRIKNGDYWFISMYLKLCILIDFSALQIKFLITIIKNGCFLRIF